MTTVEILTDLVLAIRAARKNLQSEGIDTQVKSLVAIAVEREQQLEEDEQREIPKFLRAHNALPKIPDWGQE